MESVTQILWGYPKLSSSGLAFSMTNPIGSFIYQKFLLAQGSVLVRCTKFNIQIGANMKGLGLTPSLGDRRGFLPPQLKTKTNLTVYLT